MKKLHVFLMLLVTVSFLATSCNKKEEEPTDDPERSPIVTLGTSGGVGIDGNRTFNLSAEAGTAEALPDSFVFFLTAEPQTNVNLSDITVRLDISGAKSIVYSQEVVRQERSGFSQKRIAVGAPRALGTYEYIFEVLDNRNFLGQTTVTITVTSAADCGASDLAIDNIVFNAASSRLEIDASGGADGYLYSIDGGTNWQTSNEFLIAQNGTYTVIVTDADGCTVQQSETVSDLALTTFTDVKLGAQQNSAGSCYIFSTNEVVSIAQYNNRKANLNMVYYYGESNMATLASANHETVGQVYSAFGVNTTGAGSVMLRKTSLSATDFGNRNAASTLEEDYNAGQTADGVATQLSAGNVIAFNVGGKFGLIHVKTINPSSEQGAITYDVKMQP